MFPEYVDRKLYYPYTQEDTFASGVGLGLSIVHGGKITTSSDLGKGTEIEVKLPVHKRGLKEKCFVMGDICQPIGPSKLTRCLLALLNRDPRLMEGYNDNDVRLNQSSQTPMSSLEDRLVLNGLIVTDYAFPPSEDSVYT
ncbi:hypothetical protein PZA11_002437 [Diplocarpon coronariae]